MPSEVTRYTLDSTLQRLKARYDMLDLAGLTNHQISNAPQAAIATNFSTHSPSRWVQPLQGSAAEPPQAYPPLNSFPLVSAIAQVPFHVDPSTHRYAPPPTSTAHQHPQQQQLAQQQVSVGSAQPANELHRKRIVDETMRELGYIVQGGDEQFIQNKEAPSKEESNTVNTNGRNDESYNATDYDPSAILAAGAADKFDRQERSTATADVLAVGDVEAKPSDAELFGRPTFTPDEVRRLLGTSSATLDAARRADLFALAQRAYSGVVGHKSSSRVYDSFRNVMAAEDKNAAQTTNAQPMKNVDALMKEIVSLTKHSHATGQEMVNRRAQHKRSLRPPPRKEGTAADDLPVSTYQKIRHVSAQRRTDSAKHHHYGPNHAKALVLSNPIPQGRRRVQSQPRDQIRDLFATDLAEPSSRTGGVKIVRSRWN